MVSKTGIVLTLKWEPVTYTTPGREIEERAEMFWQATVESEMVGFIALVWLRRDLSFSYAIHIKGLIGEFLQGSGYGSKREVKGEVDFQIEQVLHGHIALPGKSMRDELAARIYAARARASIP